MNQTLPKMLCVLFQLVGVSLLVTGCGTASPKPVAWTIKITKPAAIEVDLVGVTEREKPRLAAYSIDKYWSPGDVERESFNTASMTNRLTSPPNTTEWVIDRKTAQAQWKAWLRRGVTGVFVIANLPGNFDAPDARREFLTLDKNHWNASKQTLAIEVKENRILILTPEQPQQ